jgi:hypothetical protein
MKRSLFPLIFPLLTLIFAVSAWADLDPASPYLRGRGSSPSLDNLDSSRFTVKPSGRSPRSSQETKVEEKTIKVEMEHEADTVVTATPPVEEPAPPQQEAVTEIPPTAPSSQISEDDSNLLQRLRYLIMGVSDKELESLRTNPRKKTDADNSVEITLAPTYLYYDSSSKYSVRNFSSSSPGYTVGLSLWFSPYFGLEGRMQSSLAASIPSLNDDSVGGWTLSKNRIGLSFRSLSLDQPLSPRTKWRISYAETSTAVSAQNKSRVSTNSSGVEIAFEAQLPSSLSYTHDIGVSIEPKLTHREKNNPEGIKSGKSNISTAISAHVGGEIKFNRKSEIFWLLEHRYERNLFKGEPSVADPQTGDTPDGLTVDQSLTLFSIGYRWGK